MCACLLCLPLSFGVATEAAAQTTPVVTITAGPAVTEGKTTKFTWSASPEFPELPGGFADFVLMEVRIQHANSSDFTRIEGNFNIVVFSGYAGGEINVPTVNDSVDEPNGGVVITLLNGDGYTVGTPSSATVMVMDDDPTVVSLARVGSGAVTEGDNDKVEFTVTLGLALIAGETIDVPLSIGGTGVTTSDWSLALKSSATNTGVTLSDTNTATPKVTFSGASAQTATLELTATADNLSEGGRETFEIALGANSAFDDSNLDTNVGGGADPHGTSNNFEVTVNDAAPLPVITIAGGSAVTEGMAASFTLTASPVPAATLSVNVNVSESADFVASSDEGTDMVSIGTSGSATYTVPTDNDNTDEANGSVTVTVNTGTGYTVSSTSSSATVTVNDNDTRDLVLNRTSLSVNEGSSANYTVKLATKPTGTVTVTVGGTGRSITVDTDSGTGGDQSTLTFNPSGSNLWNTAQTVTVSAASDSNTANESVTLTHTTSGGDYGANSVSKTLTVTATDTTPPTLSLSLASTSGNEGDSSNSDVDITISLSPTRAASTTVDVCVKDTGTAIFRTATGGKERDFDLRAGNGTQRSVDANNCSSVTLAANSSDRRIGRLRIFGDTTPEASETAILELRNPPSGVAVSSTAGTATYTITNDDGAAPTITISGGDAVTEGTGAQFTVNASPAPSVNLTVQLDVSDDDSSDFVAADDEGRKTVTILASQTSATYTVPTNNDNTDEANGSVTVTVAEVEEGYTVGSTSSATVTVNDDDAAPLPVITIAGGSAVTEGTAASFTLTASPVPAATLSVNVNVSESDDFVASSDEGTDTMDIGTSGSATYTVPTDNDNTDEANGSVTVTVNTGTGYTVSSTSSSATVAVNDDDVSNLVISKNRLSITESGTGSYMVSLSTEPTGTVTVTIDPNNTDVTVSPASLTFHASGGSKPWNTAQTVTVSAGQDPDADDDSATLTHTASGGGYGNVPEASVTVTVDDDETPQPVASFATASSSAAEDDGTYNVTVNLSVAAPSGGLTLAYSVAGTATAVSGHDFTIQNSGMVAVVAGETTATIPVAILDDSRAESAETVILMLTDGMGYRLGSTTVHTLTITDNDKGLVISKNELSVTEGGTGSYMVSLSTEPTGTVTVTIDPNNTDVTVSPASLTFHASGGSSPWNTAQTVTVSAGQDPDADDDSATLTHTASGGGYGNVPEASVTVTVDDDGTTPTPPPTAPTPVVSISAGVPSVTEGDAISFTLSATPPPEAGTTITVTVNVAEGGSVAASGETSGRQVAISTSGMASFIVATDDDAIYEPDGSITATVQAGAGYRPHSSNASAAVSVKDNDPGLELSTGHLRVSKGGSISYTIALATQPSGPVRVSISGHEATGLTVDVASLDFTPDHWDVPQEVTLTAPGKAASITLTHTATVGNYGGIEAEVVVTVIALDPKARQGWLSRFGRTVSHQVVEGIQGRFAAPPSPPGLHLTVAGEEFINATALAENQQVLAKALGFETVTTQQLVEGSSFSFAPSADGTTAQFAIWG